MNVMFQHMVLASLEVGADELRNQKALCSFKRG